jgi:hypothetical protein
VAVALAKGVLHGDVDAARKLLIDRRAQLRMRMDGAILRYRKENELAQRGFSTDDRISSGPHQACLASMRHVLNVARRAGLGEGDCDADGKLLGLEEASARVAALHASHKSEFELSLGQFDALRAWGYERHLWHDYILLSAPLLAARDAMVLSDLAAVTLVFETRRFVDFSVGDVAYRLYASRHSHSKHHVYGSDLWRAVATGSIIP